MRLYLFLLLLASALLTSCNPDPESGPRIDLVGGNRFLSFSRVSSIPGDTFTTRVFVDTRDGTEAPLKRLSITVNYLPGLYPYAYPAVGYNRDSIPKQPASIVFLDSLLTGPQAQAVAFQFRAGTRTTSGQEDWVFTAEDINGKKNSRSFRLTLRNNDSLRLAYHSYTILLPAPLTPDSRSYLSLRSGLAFAPFALRQQPPNQALIDVAYLPLRDGGRALAALNDNLLGLNNSLLNAGNWLNRRVTELRSTSLDSTGFSRADTPELITRAFEAGIQTTPSTRTSALQIRGAANRVIAFRTAAPNPKVGLIFIQSFPTAPLPAIRMQVRILK
ncbi:hypothetical protein MTX78_21575 [Hymenobacter tibetensis]|uniref:DUF4270 family protein n=1 Tax=Hymenobacter tibetensis TaxID=497967 RepID=A0ABY4CWR5_9BACT|nr:hypothetical protein [Hymenobacter tibetensis]UOG74695.1 hypothetical protein MTX78_21575 [Hymenobacter tibetensis]